MVELVRNACEAVASPGTVAIRVSVESPAGQTATSTGNATHPIQWVCIDIIDNGPGIPANIAERIFQPFFTTKSKQNCTGLGLNVASGCVQQIGGILRHESSPGMTKFQIRLPAIA
jgi:two-component system cell cycle sensor histidine kinase/response regulator CckA